MPEPAASGNVVSFGLRRLPRERHARALAGPLRDALGRRVLREWARARRGALLRAAPRPRAARTRVPRRYTRASTAATCYERGASRLAPRHPRGHAPQAQAAGTPLDAAAAAASHKDHNNSMSLQLDGPPSPLKIDEKRALTYSVLAHDGSAKLRVAHRPRPKKRRRERQGASRGA